MFKSRRLFPDLKLSVVVACRNEQSNIADLLNCLIAQNYPINLLEIIIVNDHSTDETVSIVSDFCKSHKHIVLQNLPENSKGKKAALSYGVNKSSSDIIVTTDADCFMKPNWLKSLADYYVLNKPKMLSAPVAIAYSKKVFQKLQALEFMSLIGSGAGAIGVSHPLMCNGANLLFEKSVFQQANLKEDIVSGDDIFLMLYAKSLGPSAVQFIKSKDAIVRTKAMSTLKSFLNQRARWVSKSKAYCDFDIVFTALIVGIVNIALVIVLFHSFFSNSFYELGCLFIIKSFVDILLLSAISRFFKSQNLLFWFIPLQIIYPFYVLISMIFGLTSNFKWKSRKFR